MSWPLGGSLCTRESAGGVMERQERPAERPRPIASHRPDLDLEEGIGSGEQGGDLCQGKCGAGAVRASHASAAAVRRTCTRCTPSPQQSRVPAVPPITRAGLCHHVSAHGNLRLPRAPPPRPKRKAPTTHYTRRRRFAGDGGRDDKTTTTSEPLPGEATALPPSPRPRAKEQRQKRARVCRIAW